MNLLKKYLFYKMTLVFLSLGFIPGTTFAMSASSSSSASNARPTVFEDSTPKKDFEDVHADFLQMICQKEDEFVQVRNAKMNALSNNLSTEKQEELLKQEEGLKKEILKLRGLYDTMFEIDRELKFKEKRAELAAEKLSDVDAENLKNKVKLLEMSHEREMESYERIKEGNALCRARVIEKEEERRQEIVRLKYHYKNRLERDKQFIDGTPIYAGGIGLAAALIFTAYQATKVTAHYVEKVLGKPTLVRESSVLSIKERIRRSLVQLKHQLLMQPLVKPVSGIGDVIVASALEEQLKEIAQATQVACRSGLPLSNVMFYGAPGTGKTMFAKALARYSEMEYAVMSGADFSQFQKGDDIAELHKLFDWAQNSKKRLLVFVDECDSFLASRDSKHASQKSINLTNAFLSRVEKQTSNTIMFVFATNHPEKLDSAVLSRIGYKVEFSLPGLDERSKIFDLYIKKYVTNTRLELADDFKQHQHTLVKAMDGLSGRDIDGLMLKIVHAAFIAESNSITFAIAKKVIDWVVTEKKKEHERNRNLLIVPSVA
jgi:ATPase family AAA domain-containing protein 3A/B